MGRPTILEGRLLACAQEAGGVRELAEAWDVSRITLQRWGRGDYQPQTAQRQRANDWARNRGVRLPFPPELVKTRAERIEARRAS